MGNTPLYRTAVESGASRMKKKILGKSTWFKGGKRSCSATQDGRKPTGGRMKHNEEIKTRSVIFVEHTREGGLAKQLREQLMRIEPMMGFRLKVVERSGTQLKDMFSLTNVWGGTQCGREDCTTCNQGGDDIPDCTRRGIMYESICTKCNPGAKEPGPLKKPESEVPSIYVGESSRSIFERAGEHWKAYEKRDTDSHIWKHHIVHHQGEGKPEMLFKVVGTFRSALSRQVAEAVRIRGRGSSALNSKGEYDRCRIHRLTIRTEEQQHKVSTTPLEGLKQNRDDAVGEQYLLEKRKLMDKGKPSTKAALSKSTKRGNTEVEGGGRRSKKRKFVLVGTEWGNKDGNKEIDCTVESRTTPLDENIGGGEAVVAGPVLAMVLDRDSGGVPNGGGRMSTTEKTDGGEADDDVAGPLSAMVLDVGGDGGVRSKGDGTSTTRNTDVSTNITMGGTPGNNMGADTEPEVGRTGPLQDNLFDTANNVSTLRTLRQDCKARGGTCQEHGGKITRNTSWKNIWTRNPKTGLFGYRRRKISVLRCDGHTRTLVGTMGQTDGAGGLQVG